MQLVNKKLSMIVNTRPEKISRDLNYFAQSNQIELTNIPLTEICIKEALSQEEIEHLTKIELFDGIVFTSSSACKYGLRKIQDFMEIAEIRSSIFAIGPATKNELKEHGLEAFMPEEYNSKGMFELLMKHEMKNILLVCGTNNENLLEDHFNQILPKLEAYNVNPLEYNIGKLKSLPKKSVFLIFNLATFKLIEQNFESLSERNFIWICASHRIADYVDTLKCGKTFIAKSPTYEDMLKEAQ